MSCNKEKINNEYICVLKKIDNKVEICEYNFITELEDKVNEICILLKRGISYKTKVVNFIKNDTDFRKIFNSIDYCKYIGDSYQGIGRFWIDTESLDSITEEDEYDSKAELLIEKIRKRFAVYKFDNTLKEIKSNEKIIMYSHRHLGWHGEKYKLDKNFKVLVGSNFGYGWSSYFYTKLSYKSIDIVPFSDWVYYRYANFYSINNYSRKHSVKDASWYDSMSYVKNAIDTYTTDEESFIHNFIIDEIDKLVVGLEEIINQSKFDWKNSKFKLTGRELILFRGNKITGGIRFINSINNFKDIYHIKSIIKRIETLNIRLYPTLIKELNSVVGELSKAEKKLDSLENNFLFVEKKLLPLDKIFDRYYKFSTMKNEISLKEVKSRFNKKYNYFEELKEEYKNLRGSISDLKYPKMYTLKNSKKDLEEYIGYYDKYFNNKTHTNTS